MTALTLDIVIHALLGLVLAAAVWGLGVGGLSLLRGWPTAREAVDAYPLGLLVVTAVSAAILLEPWIGVPLALLSLALLVPLLRRPPRLGPALRGVALGLVGALGLGVVLGLIWHGPTSELDSRLYGDMLFYLNKVVSASISLAPFHDLLAEGQRIIYAEGAPSFVGAAFGFDPILFHTTTLPVFFVVSMVLGFRLLVGRWTTESAIAAAALTVVAVAYPTFLVESPPMTMALPLAFPAYRLWADELSLRHATLLAVAIGLSLFWTKALGMVALGVVMLVAALPALRQPRGRRLLDRVRRRGGGGRRRPVPHRRLVRGPREDALLPRRGRPRRARPARPPRHPQPPRPRFVLVGQLLLLALLVRARLFVFAGAYGASMAAAWFVGGYGFDVCARSRRTARRDRDRRTADRAGRTRVGCDRHAARLRVDARHPGRPDGAPADRTARRQRLRFARPCLRDRAGRGARRGARAARARRRRVPRRRRTRGDRARGRARRTARRDGHRRRGRCRRPRRHRGPRRPARARRAAGHADARRLRDLARGARARAARRARLHVADRARSETATRAGTTTRRSPDASCTSRAGSTDGSSRTRTSWHSGSRSTNASLAGDVDPRRRSDSSRSFDGYYAVLRRDEDAPESFRAIVRERRLQALPDHAS